MGVALVLVDRQAGASANGREATSDLENQPENGRYHDAATVALTRLLRADPDALSELSHRFDLEGSVTALRDRLSHLGGYERQKVLTATGREEVLAAIQEAVDITRRLAGKLGTLPSMFCWTPV